MHKKIPPSVMRKKLCCTQGAGIMIFLFKTDDNNNKLILVCELMYRMILNQLIFPEKIIPIAYKMEGSEYTNQNKKNQKDHNRFNEEYIGNYID